MSKVKCNQNRVDCFAYVNEYCCALSDTHFKGKCVFYKTREQVTLEDPDYYRRCLSCSKSK